VIDVSTNQVVGQSIAVGGSPSAIAITPDGAAAYVASASPGAVSVIDTRTNQVVGPQIPVGVSPSAIAITPDGGTAYVSRLGGVSAIDTRTNQVVGSPIPVNQPNGIAIVPDQAPLASFSTSTSRARPGVAVALDASVSSDPDGAVARYGWAFGDGQAAVATGPGESHVYMAPGRYTLTLTLTDDEGCSTAPLFTGKTAYCNGTASASQTQIVEVTYPGVRISCPRRFKPSSCRIRLQAVAKGRRGKAQSAVARVRLKAGSSRIVSLKPKPAFRNALAGARRVLVKETVRVGGAERTRHRVLKIVQ
jgi:YVTN family beta-propeller protein